MWSLIRKRLFSVKGALIVLLLAVTYAASNVDNIIIWCTKLQHVTNCWNGEVSPGVLIFSVVGLILALIGWVIVGVILIPDIKEATPKWRRRIIATMVTTWAVGTIPWLWLMHYIAASNEPDAMRVLLSPAGIFGSVVASGYLGLVFVLFGGGFILDRWTKREERKLAAIRAKQTHPSRAMTFLAYGLVVILVGIQVLGSRRKAD